MKRTTNILLLVASAAIFISAYDGDWGEYSSRVVDAASASPPDTAGSLPGCHYPITVERTVDGDTFVATIHLPWSIDLRHQMIRATGFDAWESSKRRRSVKVTDEEVVKGKAATAAVRAYLHANAGVVSIVPGNRERGPYGRVLGDVYVGGKPLANWMAEHGHLRE